MFQSQLGAAVRAAGGELRSAALQSAPEATVDADAVFVDLNADTAHRLGLIAILRERDPRRTIVGFCHHGDDQTRQMAMRVGATSCVTNGGLQAVALRLAGIPVPPGRRK